MAQGRNALTAPQVASYAAGMRAPRLCIAALTMALAAPAASAQTRAPARAAPPPPAPVPAGKPPEPMKTTEEIKRESLRGAASAPLRDLNVVRTKIPEVLLMAMTDPYSRPPRNYRCAQLIELVRPLDDVLGPDIDRINIEDEDMMERGRETALGAAADFASDAIPFRGWVRKLSGAERHDRLVRDAITAGAVRRAYLKGLGESKGCNPPATPSHEKAGTPPMPQPRTARFMPRFPTRQQPAEPPPTAAAPPAAPRR